MKYTLDNILIELRHLPKDVQQVWIEAYNSSGKEPGISAAFAALKKSGYYLDEGSKWSKMREASFTYKSIILAEAKQLSGSSKMGKVWEVVLVCAGLSENMFVYPEDVLIAALPLFDGRPAILRSDEAHLLGIDTSVEKIVGYYSDIEYRAGVGVVGVLTILDSEEKLMKNMSELWNKGLLNPDNNEPIFGYSMVAGGFGYPDLENEGVMIAGLIKKVYSVDLVVNPATKTKTLKMIEAKKVNHPKSKEQSMDFSRMLKFIESKANQLMVKIDKKENEDGYGEQVQVVFAEAVDLFEKNKPADPPAANTETFTAVEIQEFREAKSGLILERHLGGAVKLHEIVKEKVRDRLSGQIFNEAKVISVIKEETDMVDKLTEGGVLTPIGTPRIEIGMVEAEKKLKALDGFFANEDVDKVPRFTFFREAYVSITGDKDVSGQIRNAPGLMAFREALNTTSWAEILGDSVTRRMVAEYLAAPLDDWRKIVSSIVPLKDFRTQRRMRMGAYANLPTVGQGGTYQPLTSPTDEEVTYAPAKYGGTEEITIEMIANDDVGSIRKIPQKLARAAAHTLYEFVFDFIADNAAIYDAVALGHGDHSNLGSTALSHAIFIAARVRLQKQTGYNSTKRLGLTPRYILNPIDIEEIAMQIAANPVIITDAFSTKMSIVQKKGNKVEQITVPYWSDANNWALVGDPGQCPTIEMGFLNGNEEPELFVQDQPTVGSMFSADKITYKIRHIYGGAVQDYRNFDISVVA